jgi:hypothetical protein
MSTQESSSAQQGHEKKTVTIYVNGRSQEVEKRAYTYEEVVRWAFADAQFGPDIEYVVTYAKGPEEKKEGSLIPGGAVKVKENMVFNVTRTNKS